MVKEYSRDDLIELLANPRLLDFLESVRLEAAHQPATWNEINAQMQHPAEWPNLIVHMLGKIIQADMVSNPRTYLANVIAIAAACYHWHEYLLHVPEFVDAAVEAAGDDRLIDVIDKVGSARDTLADICLSTLSNDAIRAAAGKVVASNWELDDMRSAARNRLGIRDNKE